MRRAPRETWPEPVNPKLVEVWLDRDFLAQLFTENDGVLRLSVNRTVRDASAGDGVVRWIDGITWDDLMQVKRECGFANNWAVEVFPADAHVVNVARMRHLWILPEAPRFAWRQSQ